LIIVAPPTLRFSGPFCLLTAPLLDDELAALFDFPSTFALFLRLPSCSGD
jgi:hypothetical protein